VFFKFRFVGQTVRRLSTLDCFPGIYCTFFRTRGNMGFPAIIS